MSCGGVSCSTDTEIGALTIHTLATGATAIQSQALVYINANGASDELEALVTSADEGSGSVCAFSTQAAAADILAFIYIFTLASVIRHCVATITGHAGEGPHSVCTDSAGTDLWR